MVPKESQYQERMTSLTQRDKALTFDSSAVPGWFEPVPESGQHRGLTLMLDAHNDLVASSSVPDDFEVALLDQLFLARLLLFKTFAGFHSGDRFSQALPHNIQEKLPHSTWSYGNKFEPFM